MKTGYNYHSFKVGDWFSCAYTDRFGVCKFYTCEVVEQPNDRYMLVHTQDGYRTFYYKRIANVVDESQLV